MKSIFTTLNKIHVIININGDVMKVRGKVSLIVGWITLFLIGIDLFVVSPLLPFISEAYNTSPSMTGWMVTVFAITYAVFAPFFGWLSDRNGRGAYITFGLVLFATSNILTAFAPTFFWLIVSRILVGLSVASIAPLLYAIIGDVAPSNRTGTWLSILASGHLTALWAGTPFGTVLEHFWGWRSVFILLAILGAILAVVNFKTWKNNSFSHSKRNLFNGNSLRIFGSVSVTASWAIAMYALYVYLGAALYSENKFSSSEIATALIFYGIGAVIGSLAGGQLTDRFGEKKISKVTLILLTLALVCLGIFFISNIWIYFFLFLWALVGYAGFTSYTARLAVEYPNERGNVMAWNMTALYIGITLGSMLGGFVISKWGYSFLPYACSITAMLSFILSTQKVKETKTKSAVSNT